MKEVGDEECRKIQLDILVGIAEFCESHGLRYSLAYGSLIGAVRHKGFIPWDDDIDIIMPRSDYDEFVATFEHPKYSLVGGADLSNHLHHVVTDMGTKLVFDSNLNDNHYYKGGLWIDVFPIDQVPDDEAEFRELKGKIRRMYILQRYGEFPDSLIAESVKPSKKFLKRVFSWFMKPWARPIGYMLDKTLRRHNGGSSRTVADLSLWYLSWPSFPKSWLDEYVNVEFEGREFKALKEYDSFLRGIYGDYMQFPPKEEQVPKHAYKAYYRQVE